MTGKVIRVVSEKGFGFIKATDGNDYFFHKSGLANAEWAQLSIGLEVSFNVVKSPKGPRADNIKL